MDYFLNEYSLRGQFKDIDEFFDTLRMHTLVVLKKIEEEEGSLIWKKDNFWQSEICNGITLTNIPRKRNERTPEIARLQIQLIKLVNEEPFWESQDEGNLRIKEYKFDEEYRNSFDNPNCFSKALESEGRIVSFIHPNYDIAQLPLVVSYNGLDEEYSLDNIYDMTWWKSEPEIKTWKVSEKYTIQVRAKEFDYHPPHFHAICNEYAAVFKLSNGEMYACGKNKWSMHMITEIQEWYKIHKEELQKAWNLLHGK